jgi:hypothetical protein
LRDPVVVVDGEPLEVAHCGSLVYDLNPFRRHDADHGRFLPLMKISPPLVILSRNAHSLNRRFATRTALRPIVILAPNSAPRRSSQGEKISEFP